MLSHTAVPMYFRTNSHDLKKSPPLNDAGRRERRFVVGKCSYSTRSIGNVTLIRSQPVQIFCFVIL